MNIEDIIAANTAALIANTAALNAVLAASGTPIPAATTPAATTPAAEPAPKKAPAKEKAKPKIEVVPDPEPESEPEPAAETGVPRDEILQQITKKVKVWLGTLGVQIMAGMTAYTALREEFGIKAATDLPDEQLGPFLAKVEELISKPL